MLIRRAEAAGERTADIPDATALPSGPCLRRLREFPPVMGLVFGSYGEASQAVRTLLAVFARAIAAREWREMGARTEAEARGVIMTQLRRQLSLAVHAGHMRVLHARCAYVGLSHDAVVAEAVTVPARTEAFGALNEPLGLRMMLLPPVLTSSSPLLLMVRPLPVATSTPYSVV